MKREIYKVFATQVVVSENNPQGVLSDITGYPKQFDSKNYQGDTEKTRRRAEGDMSETWGAMCKVDTRQIQTVVMYSVDGIVIDRRTSGQFVEPEPNA